MLVPDWRTEYVNAVPISMIVLKNDAVDGLNLKDTSGAASCGCHRERRSERTSNSSSDHSPAPRANT
jgi:hypothetical protein